MPNAHAQFTCKRTLLSFLLVMVAFRALADQLNPCESIIWCITTVAKNFCQHVLAKIYRNYAYDDLARDCSIKHFGYTSISDTLPVPLSLETYTFHALKKPHKLEFSYKNYK